MHEVDLYTEIYAKWYSEKNSFTGFHSTWVYKRTPLFSHFERMGEPEVARSVI